MSCSANKSINIPNKINVKNLLFFDKEINIQSMKRFLLLN